MPSESRRSKWWENFPRRGTLWGPILALSILGGSVGSGPAAALPEARSASPSLLVVHARFVDLRAGQLREGSLLFQDGRIAAVGEAGGTSLAAEQEDLPRIDLHGAYLLPGLVDLRVHGGVQRSPGHVDEVGAEGTSRLLTAAGVTRYLDLQLGDEGRAWRRRQIESGSRTARIAVGSPLVTAPGGRGEDLPTAVGVTTVAEAMRVVEAAAPHRGERRSEAIGVIFDGRSPYRRLSREILAALMADMRQRQLPVIVEVGTWKDAEIALSEGAVWLCHLPEGEMPSRVRELVKALHPQWIPTVAVGVDFIALLAKKELETDPSLRRVAPAELLDDYPQVRIPQTRYADIRRRKRDLYANLLDLDAAGVKWLAGSDAGAVGSFFGWSLHRELWHWQEAGLSPRKILMAATVAPAALLGERTGFEVGDVADFVVLREDPTQDVAAIGDPVGVIVGGQWVDVDAVAAQVLRQIRAQDPPNPFPFGGRLGLLGVVVLGFAVLLSLRAAVKRAVRAGDRS